MSAPDPELKKELDATLQTRKDLGPEYEAELIDSFLEKVDQRLDSQVERRVRRELAQQRMAGARVDPAGSRRGRSGDHDNRNRRFGIAGISLVLAVPLSAIGVVNAHLPGLLITWAGIVGVNIAHSLGRGVSRGGNDEWDG
ncbi:hypothetical protein [Streptomyces silvisoli]|uniref:Integral membrane protein n=1 Tax=Streptomyces silvisoli TaxID=3034235 RepID=A0ABT5ZV57_9ACTN|nr:hypothetical protein [Streptomyces silvisoli]MDF3293714.1 hypothetical protein [Streptomyces silvisoli]